MQNYGLAIHYTDDIEKMKKMYDEQLSMSECFSSKYINFIFPQNRILITEYLNRKGFNNFEGNCQCVFKQVIDLIKLTNKPNINVMEIGFNAGHSAETFLKYNESLSLVSFDLGFHNYVGIAKEFIDMNYRGRHMLILGDSSVSLPVYIKNNKDIKFDVIFIDGGHDYNTAKSDVDNCFHLAHENTIVILNDVIFTKEWEREYTIGPTKVWKEYLEQNKIIEIERVEYSPGHGMCWGKYNKSIM